MDTPILDKFIFTPSGLNELKWVPNKIEMDRAFVTPLVMAQAVNLLIDTYALRLYIKYRIRRDERSVAFASKSAVSSSNSCL